MFQIVFVLSVFYNLGLLHYQNSDRENAFEDVHALQGTVKATQPSLHVIYCFIVSTDASVPKLDYATLEAVVVANMKMIPHIYGKFHFLTNDGEAIRAVSKYEGLVIKDFRDDEPSTRLREFRNAYISQTVNLVEYEFLCMWRWIAIADYYQTLVAQGVMVDYLLAIDNDVVLTADPTQLLQTKHATNGTELECMMIIPGAAMMWSLQGLESFVAFLGNIYANRDSATAFVKEHGQLFPLCRPDRSLLIPCAVEDGKMWHLSDMNILKAWFLRDPLIRIRRDNSDSNTCLVIAQAGSLVDGFQFQKFRSSLLGISSSNGERGNITDSCIFDVTEICVVHFQGRSKRMVPAFTSFLTRDDSFSYIISNGK